LFQQESEHYGCGCQPPFNNYASRTMH